MATYVSTMTCERPLEAADPTGFERDIAPHLRSAGFQVEDAGEGSFWIGGYDPPSAVFEDVLDESGDVVDETETWIADYLKPHLKEGTVCVLMEVGYEALRYCVGSATIITPEGVEHISLTQLVNKRLEEIDAS